MTNEFNTAKVTANIIDWISNYFKENASFETNAVIGISGGKDSSVTAALCVRALGRERVLGVLMPQGEQKDIECSRQLVDFLGIKNITVNIGDICDVFYQSVKKGLQMELNQQCVINSPSRIRMAVLYAVSACVGGRVANTCNLSEDWVGYSTKYGDSAGDFSPLSDLTVSEVIAVGDYLGLPYNLVHKTPIDGLCGKTDEENLGFTYAELDDYIRGRNSLDKNISLKNKIDNMHAYNKHKLELMPKFEL